MESGGQVWWSITDTGAPIGSESIEVPDPTGPPVPVALVEQALIATAGADDPADVVVRVDRYSTRPNPPAVRQAPRWSAAKAGSSSRPCHGTACPEQPPLSHI
ncbi:hypothetical protein [Kitasatospora griseola]|uniref:hypothetical protein n=1 Tax=Kitasatospora griseola TaxID=2064 RepID=UPI0038162B03